MVDLLALVNNSVSLMYFVFEQAIKLFSPRPIRLKNIKEEKINLNNFSLYLRF